MKKGLILLVLILGSISPAGACYFETGDAGSLGTADVVLDVVFIADTSISMFDELSDVNDRMYSIAENLDCPECNPWIRARFMNIEKHSYGYFDESVRNYVRGRGGIPLSNDEEDNGPAVTDIVRWYDWGAGITAGQEYFKAVITIGDGGTQNGYFPSINQADWDAAFQANEEAILNNVMIFSLVGTNSTFNPGHEVEDVFQAMAVGGTGGGHIFGNTGGTYALTTSETLDEDIENIICRATNGGHENPVPEPATMFFLGSGILYLCRFTRKRHIGP